MSVRLSLRIYAVASVLLTAAIPAFTAPDRDLSPTPPVQLQPISIRSGDIVLKVSDFEAARKQLLDQARKHDATLRDSQTTINFQGKKAGWLLLKSDAHDLDALINDIRPIGKLYSEHVQTTDHTAEHETLGRRIVLLKQNEQELLGFLRRPRQMRGSDVLYVQSRLYDSRVEASNAAQAQLGMERASERGMLRVSLFEPEPKRKLDWGNWHAQASYRAKGAALLLAGKFVTALYFSLWFAPIWIPSLLVFYFAGRLAIRRVKASLAAHRAGED